MLNDSNPLRSTNMSKPACPACGSFDTSAVDRDGCDDEPAFRYCEECDTEFSADAPDPEFYDADRDGEPESALTSCGWGTDESYGCFNEPDMDVDF